MASPFAALGSGHQLPINREARAPYCAHLLEQAGKLLDAARSVNRQAGSGHIAAGLLADCMESLAMAAIVHSGSAIPDPEKTERGIHRVRREQFESLYAGQLPATHYRLRILLERRNALRYVDHRKPPPWELDLCSMATVEKHIALAAEYLGEIEKLLSSEYKPVRNR